MRCIPTSRSRNLAFALKMRRVPRHVIDERIEDAAQLLEIHPLLDRKPKDLSGGQRQRWPWDARHRAQTQVILFDEPLSNLDAQLRTSMRIELKNCSSAAGDDDLCHPRSG